ncbi:MAG: Kazal-type serine protease inhibitor domain-containing protein [Bradymonadia bacterium]
MHRPDFHHAHCRRLVSALLCGWLSVCLLACERKAPTSESSPTTPANGQGVYQDEAGVTRTLFTPIEVINYGGMVRHDAGFEGRLMGYEFVASPEDEAQITFEGAGAVALYGPRTPTGLWGERLLTDAGEGVMRLVSSPLSARGHYFILIQPEGDGQGFTLSLECVGGPCLPDPCPEAPACDLFCAEGYARDRAGCRQCACDRLNCSAEGVSCPLGEVCVEGACQPAPSCEAECPSTVEQVCGADGRTYRNACTAECARQEVVARGPCAAAQCDDDNPCPSGQMCQANRCVDTPCSCTDEQEPVCSTEGNTWRNRCVMNCRGEELAYVGACVRRQCDPYAGLPNQCPEGTECFPAVSLPGNTRRCTLDPRDPECIFECRVSPDVQRCRSSDQCGNGVCYIAPGANAGICTQACRLEGEDTCPGALACASVTLQDLPEEAGACLLPCASPRETSICFDPQVCNPDDAGRLFCQSCSCDPDEQQPVCANGTTYPSPCFAFCAGVERGELTRGPCAEAPPAFCPDCPADPRPTCGEGRVYASSCEALCDSARPDGDLSCVDGDLPDLTCERDEDCRPTGCDDLICAAEESDLCADVSPEYRCFATTGACGCVNGMCQFQRTTNSDRCLSRVRRR